MLWIHLIAIGVFFQIVNFGFFAHFMYNMFYGVWAKKSGDPKVAKEKEQQLKKLHVCIKLFFVMGKIFNLFILLYLYNHRQGDCREETRRAY